MTDRAGQISRLDEPLCGCQRALRLDHAPDRWGRVRVLPLDADGQPLLDGLTPLPVERLGQPDGQLDAPAMERITRDLVLRGVDDHFRFGHPRPPFVPGQSPVPVSGRHYGADDVRTLVDSSLDFWLTSGRYNDRFERELARFLGIKHVLTVNSGSSANLLALAALTSHKLEQRALKPGDEVISVAAGFPTTVNPSLLYGLVPVFVDVDPQTFNAVPERVAEAIGPKTRAIMLAHTLGNPFDLARIRQLADEHDLWLIEDCCDALGSRYDGRLVGNFGHLATFSFYPAHHITMGEGGAVVTDDPELKKIVESLRDWGRDCWCDPGCDNTCRKRFGWQHGELPAGYDHKYVYSHVGYNLKITDMQAAVGCAQLAHLPDFIAQRRANFARLHEGLQPLADHLLLPEATSNSEPAWFGFPLLVKEGNRAALLDYLNERKIGTRLLFGGNLVRQPYFAGQKHRLHGELKNTDRIMNDALWLGVYPGLDEQRIDYVIQALRDFFQ